MTLILRLTISTFLIFQTLNFSVAQVSMPMQHNNHGRTGENTRETILTTSNVNQKSFGKIFTREVDDQMYAQPLVIPGVNIPGKGIKTIVLLATVNCTVYAFDAENADETSYFWKTSLLPAGAVPPKNSDMTGACNGNYQDFSSNIGIVGTPAIDTIAGVLYVVARTKENSKFVQRLHALNITNGTEMPNSPVQITAIYPGANTTPITFDSQKQNQRPGLLLLNGIVYIGWASHCDWGPYNGWFIGYDSKTLEQKIVYNTTPTGNAGGIWMSGQAPSVDEQGNIYIVTGNGTVGSGNDPKNVINRGESSLKLVPSGNTMKVLSWFTPYNYQFLEDYDIDLGSSGPLLIPNTKLAVFGGKQGVFYVVNRDTMGGLNTGNNNQIVQNFAVSDGHHFHGSTIYYHGPSAEYIYMWLENDALKSFKFDRSKGKFGITPAAQSTMTAPKGMPGAVLSSSSNGTKAGSGIIWAAHPLTGDANHETRPGIVRAFDANDITKELWNSEQNSSRDKMGNLAKFSCPTVVNGKLYMGTFSNQLVVYGLTTATALYRNPENPDGAIPGILYSYYQVNTTKLPDFSTLKPVDQGTINTFDIGNSLTQDTFSFKFTGYISIPEDGYYTFYTNSDDGSNLYIGNTLVVNNDGGHPATEQSGIIGLKAGLHAITVTFFEQTGDQSLMVSYSSDKITKTEIPSSVLFHTIQDSPAAVLSSGKDLKFAIFPNPTEKDFTVLPGDKWTGMLEISVYNALGNKVFTKTTQGNTPVQIELGGQPSGVYTVIVSSNNNKATSKIIKK